MSWQNVVMLVNSIPQEKVKDADMEEINGIEDIEGLL